MDAFLWLGIVVVVGGLIGLSFLLGHRTAERKAGDERDELIRFYDGREAIKAEREKAGLDRWKALLDEVKEKAEDNEELALDLENKWQPQPAEHHQGKAAAYRDILIRYRGW